MSGHTDGSLQSALIVVRIDVGSPTIGAPYLLPAFTAAFLGSTQFGRGRFNVWGTVIAVYVLAIGTKGINLVGGPFWLPDAFNGVALALAVGFSTTTANSEMRRWWRKRRAKMNSAEPIPG